MTTINPQGTLCVVVGQWDYTDDRKIALGEPELVTPLDKTYRIVRKGGQATMPRVEDGAIVLEGSYSLEQRSAGIIDPARSGAVYINTGKTTVLAHKPQSTSSKIRSSNGLLGNSRDRVCTLLDGEAILLGWPKEADKTLQNYVQVAYR